MIRQQESPLRIRARQYGLYGLILLLFLAPTARGADRESVRNKAEEAQELKRQSLKCKDPDEQKAFIAEWQPFDKARLADKDAVSKHIDLLVNEAWRAADEYVRKTAAESGRNPLVDKETWGGHKGLIDHVLFDPNMENSYGKFSYEEVGINAGERKQNARVLRIGLKTLTDHHRTGQMMILFHELFHAIVFDRLAEQCFQDMKRKLGGRPLTFQEEHDLRIRSRDEAGRIVARDWQGVIGWKWEKAHYFQEEVNAEAAARTCAEAYFGGISNSLRWWSKFYELDNLIASRQGNLQHARRGHGSGVSRDARGRGTVRSQWVGAIPPYTRVTPGLRRDRAGQPGQGFAAKTHRGTLRVRGQSRGHGNLRQRAGRNAGVPLLAGLSHAPVGCLSHPPSDGFVEAGIWR